LRRPAPETAPTVAFVCSFVAVALALLTSWLGGELTFRLGIGVDKDAHADAPSSLSGRPAKEPEARGPRLVA
jgi:hypothetical protein